VRGSPGAAPALFFEGGDHCRRADSQHAGGVADQGPKGQIGEGSIALAEALGIPSNPRHGGVVSGILYLVFPGSGNAKPRPLEEITAEATRLFEAWGGTAQMGACFP